METEVYTVWATLCRWHGPWPAATLNTFEDAKQWILSHYSEWVSYHIDPVPED